MVLDVSSIKELSIQIGSLNSNTIIESVIANSGSNGKDGKNGCSGGNGGSGGGAGVIHDSNIWGPSTLWGGSGGMDGSNGSGSGRFNSPGVGQGTTTRAFGESDGTLYASGGAGGSTSMFHIDNGGNGNPETNGLGIAIIRWGY